MKGFGIILGAVVLAFAVTAQEKAVTGRTRVGAGIDGAVMMLDYGRPAVAETPAGETNKFIGGVIPYGRAWPVGGKPVALLSSDKELVIGKVVIPAGTNSLYLWIAPDDTAKLLISKQLVEGELGYDPAQDLARVDLQRETLPRQVNQFTMALVMDPAGGGTLKMMLQTTQFSARFFVRR
jgi:hypothetical protein